MRISDVVGAMGLGLFPSISMVIFAGVFAWVLWSVASMSRRRAGDAAQLPLDDTATRRGPDHG